MSEKGFRNSWAWHAAFRQFVKVRHPWPHTATESSLRATFNISRSPEYLEARRRYRQQVTTKERQKMAKRSRQVPTVMDRTRAAVAYINTTREGRDGDSALNAFLAIFHPEIPEDKRVQMVKSAKRED